MFAVSRRTAWGAGDGRVAGWPGDTLLVGSSSSDGTRETSVLGGAATGVVGDVPELGVAAPAGDEAGGGGGGGSGSDDDCGCGCDSVSCRETSASATLCSSGGEMPGSGAGCSSDSASLASGETYDSAPGVSAGRGGGVGASVDEPDVRGVPVPGAVVPSGPWGDAVVGCNVETASTAASPTISRMRSSSSRSGDDVLAGCGGTEPTGSGSSAKAAAVATSQSMRIATGGSGVDASG